MARERTRTQRLDDGDVTAKITKVAGTYPLFYEKARPILHPTIINARRLMEVVNGWPARQEEVDAVLTAIDVLHDRPRRVLADLSSRIAAGGGTATISFGELACLHEALLAGETQA